jgi:lipoate synthase
MAIYQNRLPLHWCLPISMYLYREASKDHGLERRALDPEHIADLLKRLPEIRGVVLVGQDVQEAWDRGASHWGDCIKVWRCEEPTDQLKQLRPDLWLTIPSRLPTRADVGG